MASMLNADIAHYTHYSMSLLNTYYAHRRNSEPSGKAGSDAFTGVPTPPNALRGASRGFAGCCATPVNSQLRVSDSPPRSIAHESPLLPSGSPPTQVADCRCPKEISLLAIYNSRSGLSVYPGVLIPYTLNENNTATNRRTRAGPGQLVAPMEINDAS
ncbi:hypothetical protein BOTBODRAFT_50096 [Botryobasidium botryosum FD-172 SS1]|uniref:Uncharacterized protein n=1 Tax=Botryobasidium botryosum (strain FD-172 SS1) TaxID=930990 RepID=A0A067NCG0_BOTB1|nr:hypothetical protein BOTBODRAFT_50096 [Botryobasidium botryosum FD-172 SS1]